MSRTTAGSARASFGPTTLNQRMGLHRIEPGDFVQREPVPAKSRALRFTRRVQPSGNSASQAGPLGVHWVGPSLEFNGALWMWALRDAVQDAGHQHTPTESFYFYRRISNEVNLAADTGELMGGPRNDSFLPTWNAKLTRAVEAEYGLHAETLFLEALQCTASAQLGDAPRPRNLQHHDTLESIAQ